MELNLVTVATLKHINLRQEGPKDAPALAFDLKLVCNVEADVIDDLLCVDNEGQALECFWKDDKDGKPRFPQLSSLSFSRRINEVELNTLGMHLPGCRLGGFSFEALDGKRANLQFSCAVSQPPGNALPILADFLAQDIEIELLSQQGDLLAQREADADHAIPRLRPEVFDRATEEQLSMLQAMAATLPVGPVGEDQDELLASARGFVIRSDRASISAIQRFLRIGYNRAARLIETLETEGVITAPGPDGTRHVLATL